MVFAIGLQEHPVVEMNLEAAVADLEIEMVLPVHGIATRDPARGADDTISLAGIATLAIGPNHPDAPLFLAVFINEILDEGQRLTIPSAVDIDRELPAQIGEKRSSKIPQALVWPSKNSSRRNCGSVPEKSSGFMLLHPVIAMVVRPTITRVRRRESRPDPTHLRGRVCIVPLLDARLLYAQSHFMLAFGRNWKSNHEYDSRALEDHRDQRIKAPQG